MRGFVRETCLKRVYEPNTNYIYNTFPGYSNIQVCSSNALPEFIGVSPIVLGPIWIDDPFVKKCERFENFWQWLKVFKNDIPKGEQSTLSEFHKNESKWFEFSEVKEYLPDPSKNYFDKRRKWFEDRRIDLNRLKKNKIHRNDFLYFWYNGEKINDYVEGRKVFYCHLYAQYVQDTSAYKSIKSRLERGENLCLTGWDASEWSEEEDPKCELLYERLMNKDSKFGHESVLVCLLTGNIIWK